MVVGGPLPGELRGVPGGRRGPGTSGNGHPPGSRRQKIEGYRIIYLSLWDFMMRNRAVKNTYSRYVFPSNLTGLC